MKNTLWSRRTFIKTAIVGAALLFSNPAFPMELLQEDKTMPEGRIILNNGKTGERLDVRFRDEFGEYDPDALKSINHLMRCHYSDEELPIDIGVIEFLNAVDKQLGGYNEIEVISGYRSKKYNDMLRRKSRRVARHSLHLVGKAVDFRIQGIKLKEIKKTALNMEYGGVGYYPRANFVHLDSGRFRFW